MEIPITFLGTGQAIPTAKRNHTAVLIQYKDENILVDCGEGTQRQFRKAKLNMCNLTRLLITHWHGDHILGIPGMLQTLALNHYNKTLEIYGPKGTKRYMDLMYSLFVPIGKIKIKVKEVSQGKIFETKDFAVYSEKMEHGAPCVAYCFVEKEKLRIDKNKLKKLKLNGKIISKIAAGKNIIFKGKKIKASQLAYKQPGRKISFVLDTGMNNNAIKIAKDSNVLICESTFLADSENGAKLAQDYKHLTAKQAATIAKKAKVNQLILTHLSQRYENKEKLILNEAKKVFKNTKIVEDLDRIKI